MMNLTVSKTSENLIWTRSPDSDLLFNPGPCDCESKTLSTAFSQAATCDTNRILSGQPGNSDSIIGQMDKILANNNWEYIDGTNSLNVGLSINNYVTT